MPTYFGTLDLHLRREGTATLVASVGGDLAVPPGGVVLRPPLARRLESVEVNARAATDFDATGVTIDECPARVVLRG